MLELEPRRLMCETASDLPQIPGQIGRLYLDYETGSGSATADSLSPWHTCYPLGACVTWDDNPNAYYVPIAHQWGTNVDKDSVYKWLRDLMSATKTWVNHHVKYDAHVHQNNVGPVTSDMCCTVVGSKIIDSDRFRYSLDAVSQAFLHEDISAYEDALKPYLNRNKDYSAIPSDIMAPYGCQDVITGRRLDKYIRERMPEDCYDVWSTEQRLTKLLFKMEQRGVCIDPDELKRTELLLMTQVVMIEEALMKKLGRVIRPHVSEDCYEVLVGQYGLPVLGWTDEEETRPSFDKDTLKAYLTLPDAPRDIIKTMLKCRELNTMLTIYVQPWQALHIDGILHPNHNQLVRTGRMSCSHPNTQQLNKLAKSLIHPRHGCAFISTDASQIEFRTIAHYIQDQKVIKAFIDNPRIDFHQWVADMPELKIKRRPAKTVNFSVAFGQGRKSTVSLLSRNEDIVADITSHVETLPEHMRKSEFDRLVKQRGEAMYDRYHDEFPGIKRTSRQAASTARIRGYVRNIRGRHRHIPAYRANIAFNTLNQGSAADIVKDGMVRLDDVLPDGVHILLQVHDEILLEGPEEVMRDESTWVTAMDVLELPDCDLRVPVRWDLGVSATDWREAASDEAKVDLEGAMLRAGRDRRRLPHKFSK